LQQRRAHSSDRMRYAFQHGCSNEESVPNKMLLKHIMLAGMIPVKYESR
jgi:hypothetical protein